MSQRGFTLVELMVVVALIALLMTWGIPAYSTWNSRQNVEGEIGRLYSDLQFARMTAYSNKNLTGIYWGGGTSITQYSIETNTNTDATSIDTGTKQLGATVSAGRFPITSTQNQKSVSFDGRGLLYTGSVTFYITPNYGAGTNCVAVSLTSIVSGKWDGTNCNP